MKHKHFKHLFTALLLLCATAVAAHDFEVGGIYYNILSEEDKTVEVTFKGTSYYEYSNEYTGSVVIPQSVVYNGKVYSVTSIGYMAFYNCSGLTGIEIPNSVTSIGYKAFDYCTGLTSVTIPNSVTSIGNYAFDGTAWYNNQPDGVVYAGKVLYKYKGTMPSYTSITIKDGTLSITDCAFSECSGLTSIEIPNSVTSIGEDAFSYCYGLTSIEIPNSVTSIGYNAFSNCYVLTSITIPNSVTSIGDYAFYKCYKLTSITIPNSVTSIGDYAFYKCTGLTSVVIGNSVTSIGNYAFYDCDGLKTVVNLSDLTFTKGSSSYGYVAYYADKIINNGFIEGDFVFNRTNGVNTLVAYLGNATELTLPADCEGETYVIGDYAFYGCTGLTSITIPNSVTSIGDMAFWDCSGLTSIEIPGSVTSIGTWAFYGCTGLKSVEFNAENCTSMGSYSYPVFYGCAALSTVTIGENVKNIPDYAFSDCKGLTSITIPNSVTSIGNYAFYNCRSLTSIEIPNSVTSIAYCAFQGCSGLTSIEIPNSVTSIGWNTFYNCRSLTSIEIPSSVTSIGSSAFEGCIGLTSIEIPNSVTSIGNAAFRDCSRLTSITIPNSVTSIGYEAFYKCSGLTSVTIPNSVTSIGSQAFYRCSGLTSITSLIPAEYLFAIDSDVFSGVNKTTCTLYVPYGAKETYASTAGWKAFSNIVEMAPESQPGDINKDGEVNVGDFAALVNIIFNSEEIDETTKSVSDINADGEVNVGDFAALVNLIFNSGSQASPQRAATRAAADETTFYIEPFSIAAGETKVIPVLMENPGEKFSQLQFDITLPEGLEIPEYFDEEQFDDVKDIKRGSRTKSVYSIQTQPVGEALRVLCITQNSKAFFTGESGDVLLITVKAADDIAIGDVEIKITNTVLSRQDGTTYKPADCTATVSVTDGTGIDEMKEQRAESKDVYYDLSGRAVENPTSGIYIIDGKKVLVK